MGLVYYPYSSEVYTPVDVIRNHSKYTMIYYLIIEIYPASFIVSAS